MTNMRRFTVSIEKALLEKFDKYIKQKGYPTRSEAFRILIRNALVNEEWTGKGTVAGAITIVYNHHRRDLNNKLTDIQHNFLDLIVSSQHIHLDKHNCMEIISVKGDAKKIEKLAYSLHSEKGVKHSKLTTTTTGSHLP
jgi:CopG family transcriptional regulator, nickel-responsive regulator